jgi:hypothetical protein
MKGNRSHECYLKQQVTYQSFDEGEQITINATRVSFFSYEYKDDDPSILTSTRTTTLVYQRKANSCWPLTEKCGIILV